MIIISHQPASSSTTSWSYSGSRPLPTRLTCASSPNTSARGERLSPTTLSVPVRNGFTSKRMQSTGIKILYNMTRNGWLVNNIIIIQLT